MTPTRNPEQSDSRTRRSRLCRALGAFDNRIFAATESMSPRQSNAWLLGISVLFAGVILSVSWLVNPDDSQTLVNMLVLVWWIPFSVLASARSASGRGRCAERD